MNTLPNCHYCGKFCNPDKPGVKSEDVYGFMGIDDIIYFHEKCREASAPSPVLNLEPGINPYITFEGVPAT